MNFDDRPPSLLKRRWSPDKNIEKQKAEGKDRVKEAKEEGKDRVKETKAEGKDRVKNTKVEEKDRVKKTKAEEKDRVKKTKAQKAVEQIRKHAYKVEIPDEKEYQIVKLLGEACRHNPTALFNDEEEEEDKGRGKVHKSKQGDDVELVPFYDKAGPSTSKAASWNTTSELRGQVEVKYQHIEESDFKRNFLNRISGTLEEKIEVGMANNFKLLNIGWLDTTFKKEMVRKLQSRKYQEMMEVRKKLPSFKMRHAILNLINNNQISVISGETGCGKTTQVPQFILDDMIAKNKGSECFIMVTQPRRISAIAIAERVAQERDEDCDRHRNQGRKRCVPQCGSSVGYQIGLEKELPRKRGSMLYCTAGILLETMQSDPILSGVSHIIMDEIHERTMISDFLLAILKDVTNKRKDLKLVLMSATLNAEKFSEFFGGAPILHIPGFTFPVNEYYLEDVLHMTRFRPSPKLHLFQRPVGAVLGFLPRFRHNQGNQRGGGWGGGRGPNRDVCNDLPNIIEPYISGLRRDEVQAYPNDVLNMLKDPELEGVNNDVIFSLLQYISTQRPGAVLVFLPGWDTINSLHWSLCQSNFFNSSRFQIIPLHSMLPTVSQKAIFNTPPEGVRKIVLATNIAETSITIDDIVYVVDCGKTKMNNFDVQNNIATLKPEWISLANARQRRGRAGRVQDGVCYHLYSRAREQTFQDYPLPEIQRTRLDEVILKAKMLQLGKIAPFLQKVLDPPDEASVHLSLKLLRLIDALDDDEHLTPLGYHLAKLPSDPQIGKMLLMASIFSCVDPVLTVAASLGFKDPFCTPMNMQNEVDKQKTILAQGATSDYTVLINAMQGWETALEQGYSDEYCCENFLTNSTLLALRDMKYQFSRHLHDMKFIGSNNPKAGQANLNSHNMVLVNAIIASGLYPNVGVIERTIWNKKMNKHFSSITTPDDGHVCIHPKSVNSNQPSFDSPFVVYYMKLKGTTGGINLHDTSSVYPLPLIFFAHDMKSHMLTPDTDKDNEPKEIITVLDCLSFECKPSTAKLIKELRTRLNMLLAHKLSHPGTTEWGDPNEGNILKAMIELITNEDKRNRTDDCSQEEDDDNNIWRLSTPRCNVR